MGGGLMQLVAYGAQDIYLTGNPQITFFKVVYRRHTNFSMETISQTLNGNPTIGNSQNEASCTISRNGDLIYKMYVVIQSSHSTNIHYGSEVVQSVELEIGGQLIDKYTSEWNDIWNELTLTNHKALALKEMFSDTEIITDDIKQLIQVPLNFYFCKNPGLALPLIALQYHEVKINFVFGSTTNTNANSGTPIKFYVDYIYLDTDERRRFAQVSHEYLIEQVQIQSMDSNISHDLNFNHPVKELIWVTDTDYGSALLKLNGHDRFEKQQKEYFQLRQPFDYHTHIPRQNLSLQTALNYYPISDKKSILKNSSIGLKLGIFNTKAVTEPTTGYYYPTNFIPHLNSLKPGETNPVLSLAVEADDIAPSKTIPTEGILGGAGRPVVGNKLIDADDEGTGGGETKQVFYVFNKNDVENFLPDYEYQIEFEHMKPPELAPWLHTMGSVEKLINPHNDPKYGFTKNSSLNQSVVCVGVFEAAQETTIAHDNYIFIRFDKRIENIHKLLITDNDGNNFSTAMSDADSVNEYIDPSVLDQTDQHGLVALQTLVKQVGDDNGEKYNFLKIKNISQIINSHSGFKRGRSSQLNRKINIYSFALKPEDHQPSGTCNFSRIDTAILEFDTEPTDGNIYAINYNVLRIMSGMGGLAYSN